MLASNSLELYEGASKRLARRVDHVLKERYEQLHGAQPIHLYIDGHPTPAHTVTHGQHTIWWIANATPNTTAVIYAWAWPHTPTLRTTTIAAEHPSQ